MVNLRKARDEGKVDEFGAEHEAEGDETEFNRLFEAMAGASKEAPEAL